MMLNFNAGLNSHHLFHTFVLFALLQYSELEKGISKRCMQLLAIVPIAFLTWPSLGVSKALWCTNSFKLSTKSKQHTLYILNMGKFISALILLWFRDTYRETTQHPKTYWGGWEYLIQFTWNVFVVYGSAMLLGQLSWDPKMVRLDYACLWCFNQLFVCLAEEIIYREFLGSILPPLLGASTACLVECLLFGAAHHQPRADGKLVFPTYPAFCALQGLFYHRAYKGAPEDSRLTYAATYHGIFNMARLLMFPYPNQEMARKPAV